MDDLGSLLINRLGVVLHSHLGEFLVFQCLLLFLTLLAKWIVFRKLWDSPSRANKILAVYNICSLGLEFCILGVAGVITASKIESATLSSHTFVFFTIISVCFLILASCISGCSDHKPSSLVLCWDSWLGMLIPDTIGILSFYIAAILILGTT
jgi:hypothetical protein